jgi:hypothetical protein
MQVAEAFLGHAAVQDRLAEEVGSRCAAALSLAFEGSVESELEAIFCRGIEWDIGIEHLLLFQACCLLHTCLSRCISYGSCLTCDSCQWPLA